MRWGGAGVIPYKSITLSMASRIEEGLMFIANGILGALFGGAFCAFLVALIALYIPFMGWFSHLVIPTFYITGFIIGLYLALRTYPR